MATIVTREVGATAKNSPLTNAEVDANFINLNAELATKLTVTDNLATELVYEADLLGGIGAFASATGWTLGTGWSITGGQAVYTSGDGLLSATISVVSGSTYQVDWTHVSGTYNVTFSGGAVSTAAMPYWGNRSVTFVAGATGSVTFSIAMNAAATIDDVIIRKVVSPGGVVAYTLKDASGSVGHSQRVFKASLLNTATGVDSLKSNTTGFSNTANGLNALYSNTTGNYNTANGVRALYSSTTSNYNTANGYQALYSNTTGHYNTANGMNALYSNTTGNNNTANGVNALYSNTTGYNNTATGLQTLLSNTTGNYNTANGYQALCSNTTGYYNTANGMNALYSNTTGYNNTATGGDAGRFTNAGAALTTANSSVFIGCDTRSGADGSTNEIVIGLEGRGAGSNTATIGNTSTTLQVLNGNTLRLTASRTPASASAAGVTGDMCWDANYIYVCVATNTWRRIAHSSW